MEKPLQSSFIFWIMVFLFSLSTLYFQTTIGAPQVNKKYDTAIFAGGCFWCMQPPFDKLKGVISTAAGYTNGEANTATYEKVSAGGTGHLESIEVTYDPSVITYEKLLETYWQNIDPFDDAGQFCDKGAQYQAVIFYKGETEKKIAEQSKTKMETLLKAKIVTQLLPAKPFYKAEEYHQEYHTKNPLKYKFYRYTCGRDARLEKVWGTKP